MKMQSLTAIWQRLWALISSQFLARRRLLREVGLILLVVVAYLLTRTIDVDRPEDAFEHARAILAFENWASLNPEVALQSLALHYPWLMSMVNVIYLWAHIPVLVAVAIWLYRQHPQGYAWFRTAFLCSAALGLTIYVMVPVAPPRFMPGFVDTLKLTGMSIDSSAAGSIYNPYGAMPSLHVAWESLAGVALLRYARSWPLKLAGAALPIAMTLIVLMTGNHYLLDTIAGMLIAAIALLFSSAWFAWHRQLHTIPAILPTTEARAPSYPLIPVPARERR